VYTHCLLYHWSDMCYQVQASLHMKPEPQFPTVSGSLGGMLHNELVHNVHNLSSTPLLACSINAGRTIHSHICWQELKGQANPFMKTIRMHEKLSTLLVQAAAHIRATDLSSLNLSRTSPVNGRRMFKTCHQRSDNARKVDDMI
jgi:hypothetical protein